MTFHVDLEALTTDARIWDGISGALHGVKRALPGLRLSTSELSWAAEATGFATAYDDFVDRVRARVAQGETETERLGDGLRKVRAAYQDSDTRARDRFDGLWEPVSDGSRSPTRPGSRSSG